ncbi:cation:proton antiporter [Salininema proteolyticum]|uniref:Cation:proton antiporter n=1 Tax=Salininema proteolyticum TaxID=1607685 RepID=A0ABV8U5R1_9ACTN
MDFNVDQNLAVGLFVAATAGLLAPLLSEKLRRWVLIPTVVLEILLGILFGPHVLDWIKPNRILEGLSQVGMAMLFFIAGFELNLGKMKPRLAGLAASAWLIAVGVVAAVAALTGAGHPALWAIALCSTALGTVLPIAKDAGALETPVDGPLKSTGAVGEFGPILLLALFFSHSERSATFTWTLLLIGLAFSVIALSRLRRSDLVSRVLTATLGTSAQFAVRLALMALMLSIAVTAVAGVDVALGAMTAGMLIRLLLTSMKDEDIERVQSKFDAIGYGAFIPVFFVYTGVTFPVDQLWKHPSSLAMLPLFLVAFLVLRGGLTWLFFARHVDRPHRGALALFASVELPLVIVAAQTGLDRGIIDSAQAASLMGAALVSVLLYTLLGLHFLKKAAPKEPTPAE